MTISQILSIIPLSFNEKKQYCLQELQKQKEELERELNMVKKYIYLISKSKE